MRNVQVWSVVAALIVANCCFGQLLRSRRQCCQPVCQSCSTVSNATYTEYATAPVSTASYIESAPVYASNVSYGEVVAQPVSNEISPVGNCSTCSTETQVYPAESAVVSGATFESPVSYEATVSDASQVSYETPVVSTQAYEVQVPAATAVAATPVYQSTTPVAPVSFVQPAGMTMTNQSYTVKSTPRVTQASYSASYGNANSDQMRVLSVVNRKRQRSGLSPLRFDPSLASVAQRKSYYRASRGMTGHDGSNMGGASVEGVGFSYGQADPVEGFNTCYLYSNGYQSCGCAVSYDANNRAYYTLLLR